MDFCRQVVAYSRTRMIGNEAQALALALSMLTAYAPSPKEYTSTGIVGELASGKTLAVNVVLGEHSVGEKKDSFIQGLFPQPHIHRITSATSKALIYSEALKEPEFGSRDSPVKIIYAAEYQKLTQEIIEYFKSQSGDDPLFEYEFTDVTTKSTRKITQRKRVFVFTYAQIKMDEELGSRIIRFAVEENKNINKCVVAVHHGAPFAKYKGFQYTLKGDPELEAQIREQIEFIAGGEPIKVENPFYLALSDLEDCSRASSKRVSAMTEALFKSSARFNFTERKKTEDGTVLIAAQDLVNVLSLTEIIQSLVLEIDVIDLAIVRFLGISGKSADKDRIIAFLSKSGLPELTQTEFSNRIGTLIELNYVTEWFSENDNKKDGKKAWYKLNKDKYIHPLTIHWDEAYAVDPGPVENPITGDRYANIIEFGKAFDEMIRRGIEINARERDPDYVPSFEDTVYFTVKKLISQGGQYHVGDTAVMRKDCMFSLGQTSLTDYQRFEDAINEMVESGVLDIDPVTNTYVILDPSIKSNHITRKTVTTGSVLE